MIVFTVTLTSYHAGYYFDYDRFDYPRQVPSHHDASHNDRPSQPYPTSVLILLVKGHSVRQDFFLPVVFMRAEVLPVVFMRTYFLPVVFMRTYFLPVVFLRA